MSEIYFPALCLSNSRDWALWSRKVVWDTPDPDITLCFQYTILNWVPLLFLWVSCSIYIPTVWGRSNAKYQRIGKFNIFKSILICLIMLVHVINLCKTIKEVKWPPLAMLIQPVLSIITSALLIYLNRLIFLKGIHTSGVLFFYWLLQFVASFIILYSRCKRVKMADRDIFRTVTATLEFVLVLASFVSICFADQAVFTDLDLSFVAKGEDGFQLISSTPAYNGTVQRARNFSPEHKASFLSELTFTWLTPFIMKGFQKSLTFNDLYELEKENTCRQIIPKIVKEWNAELERTSIQKTKASTSDQFKINYQILQIEDSGHEPTDESDQNVNSPSFCKALFKTIGYPYISGAFLSLIYDLLSFVQPLLLGLFIKFIEIQNDHIWHGFFYAFCFFIIAMIQTVLFQRFSHICSKTGMRSRTAIIGIIYRKALKLSLTGQKETTVGEILNLMSVDCQNIQDVFIYLYFLWSCPITIIIAFVFLWQHLGASILSGFAILLCLVPVNVIMAVKVKSLQSKQMKIKDSRMKLINEVLSVMQMLKLYAWEKLFEKKIQQIRNDECQILRTSAYIFTIISISWFSAPFLVSLCTFATYILSNPNNNLTVYKAFISLTIFNILNGQLQFLPDAIIRTIQARVSLQRINKFLQIDELDPENVEVSSSQENPMTVVDGTFSWEKTEIPVLKDINLEIEQGSLVAVVGAVGSGKTSLASALIGEMSKVSGQVKSRGSIAYVPQQAWCIDASVMNNIIFNKPMNVYKYNMSIEACALSEDLKNFPIGDQTKIGEKGINLSGGQKQRISLARAVYQDSSIYILDDPLSAVDSHVGKHIFDQVIGRDGLLSNKTRILITHGLTYLPEVDKIFVMEHGQITESGTFVDLLNSNRYFGKWVKLYLERDNDGVGNDADEDKEVRKRKRQRLPGSSTTGILSSIRSSTTKESISREAETKFVKNMKRIEDEFVEINMKFRVYLSYIQSATYLVASVALFSYMLYMVFFVGTNVFLCKFTETQTLNGTERHDKIRAFLIVYGGLGAGQVIFILMQNFSLAYGTFLASKSLHKKLLKSILRAPNLFFDTTPMGRILNRIGQDIAAVDVNILPAIRYWLLSLSAVMGSLIFIVIASPYFVIALVPLIFLYIMIKKFFKRTSRQLIRIDSMKRSPIFSHFEESLTGLSSIRTYKAKDEFIKKCDWVTDDHQKAWYPNFVSFRWLHFNLEFIGNIVILLTGIFAVLTRSTIGASLAGLSISLSLQISWTLSHMVRMTCFLEANIMSVERIQEYINIEQEAPWDISKTKPSQDWPSCGEIEFKNYSVRYRPDSDLVLTDLSFVIRAGEKIGIVGRTGAGKSSLALGLFRLIEPAGGSIFIDGIDISKLGLQDLRQKLTIIPQDPMVFCGTLRTNLDPFGEYSDAELWTALEMVHLKSFVTKSLASLDFCISKSGENLSVGQKQLICLARALLKRTKILVLDEATSAMDLETDDLIQRTIREQFHKCTVLTIAHRINTIMDYDRVLVLEQGRKSELDTPENLLRNTSSSFYSIVMNAGLV